MAKYHDTFTNEGMNKAIEIARAINLLGGKARVATTYLDYGQDWTWETILVESKSLNMEYQALSPRDFKEMNAGELSVERVQEIVKSATKM
jgi:hypothetical protein